MRILLIGYGSIGKRHATNILNMNIGEIFVVEPFEDGASKAADQFGIQNVFKCIDEALIKHSYHIAFILSPTYLHAEQVSKLLPYVNGLFIEKPLVASRQEIAALNDQAEQHKTSITMVGCNMRFYPSIKYIQENLSRGKIGKLLYGRFRYGQYLPSCRPGIDYRSTYCVSRLQGGGIVLDDIHEIDLAYYFFGSMKSFSVIGGHISKLEMDCEDCMFLTMRADSGAIVQITSDYLIPCYRREIEIVGEKGAFRWDEDDNVVRLAMHGDDIWYPVLDIRNYDYSDIYKDEIAYFINCIQHKKQPMNNIMEAREVLEMTLNIREEIYRQMDEIKKI